MECRKTQNRSQCNCTSSCSRKGICCECLEYHRAMDELPACYFDPLTEKTYNRSLAAFIRSRKS